MKIEDFEKLFTMHPWTESAWRALDVANSVSGETPFHVSIIVGNKPIVSYLMNFIKMRERYMKLMEEMGEKCFKYMTFKECLEYKSFNGFTPFLLACRDNNF
jgi:hypothetical protein